MTLESILDTPSVGLSKRLQALVHRRAGLAIGLWGQAGIGKSFTVQQVLQQCHVQHFSVHSTATLQTWLLALPRPAQLPPWCEVLLLRLTKGEYLDTEQTLDALAALLGALSPVVLYLEDIHEASPQRLELIQGLAGRIGRIKGVGLLITSRTQPPEPFESLPLGPLSAQDTQELLENELKAKLPKEASSWIYGRAAGNPLFSLEYVRHLSRQGFLWNDGQRWHWRIPPQETLPLTVEALIEHQLAQVADQPALLQVLEAKALVPHQTQPGLWAVLSQLGPADFAAAKQALGRAGIFQQNEFAHPLFRELTVMRLSAARRTSLARLALAALAHDPMASAPFVEAAKLQAEQTLGHYQAAANQARLAGNPVQAAGFLAQAAQHAQGQPRAQLALEAAGLLRQVNVQEAARLARLALEEDSFRAEALELLAELEAVQVRLGEAERLLEQIELSPLERLRKQIRLRGLAQQHALVLELVRQHPEVLDEPDPEMLHRAARSLAQVGQVEEAQILVERGLALPNLPTDQRAMLLRAASLTAYKQGQFARMEALEQSIAGLANELQDLRLKDQALFNRALALESLGRWAEQRDCLEQAMQVCVQLGDTTALMIAQKFYALALHEQGQHQEAETLLMEAKTWLDGLDVSGYLVDCEHHLCQLYLEWQPPHGKLMALKYARLAVQHSEQLSEGKNLDSLGWLALALAWNNQPAQALETAQHILLLAQDSSDVQNAKAVLARVGKAVGHPEALALLREAEGLAVQQEAWLEAHKLGLEADQLEQNLEQAQAHLEWFELNGLLGGVHLVRRMFPHLEPSTIQPTSPEKKAVPTLRLEVLGSIQLSGEPLRGRKRQELLAFLLESRIAGKAEVSKLELIDALYPDEDEEKATSSLKGLIYNVRSSFGANALNTTALGYGLGEQMTSDAEEFLLGGDTALWRGAYLEGLTPFNQTVQESVYLALLPAAKALLESDPKEALRLAKILLEADPYDTEALRLMLKALLRSQNLRSLQRLYQEARQRMLEVGEHLPETWQMFLLEAPTGKTLPSHNHNPTNPVAS